MPKVGVKRKALIEAGLDELTWIFETRDRALEFILLQYIRFDMVGRLTEYAQENFARAPLQFWIDYRRAIRNVAGYKLQKTKAGLIKNVIIPIKKPVEDLDKFLTYGKKKYLLSVGQIEPQTRKQQKRIISQN